MRFTFGRAWMLAMALLYLVFIRWYGGSAPPVSAAEGAAYLARMQAVQTGHTAFAAHPEILTNLADWIAHDDGREFYMVNLVGLNPSPAGRAADAAYARHILPLLLKHGAHPVFVGTVAHSFMGNGGHGVDRLAIVRYRSLRDFLDMNLEPDIANAADEKFAGLARTQNFAVHPVISLAMIRILVGFILAGTALAGNRLARPRTTKNPIP